MREAEDSHVTKAGGELAGLLYHVWHPEPHIQQARQPRTGEFILKPRIGHWRWRMPLLANRLCQSHRMGDKVASCRLLCSFSFDLRAMQLKKLLLRLRFEFPFENPCFSSPYTLQGNTKCNVHLVTFVIGEFSAAPEWCKEVRSLGEYDGGLDPSKLSLSLPNIARDQSFFFVIWNFGYPYIKFPDPWASAVVKKVNS